MSLCFVFFILPVSVLGIPKPRTITERVFHQQPPSGSVGRPTAPTASKLPVKGLPTGLSSSSLVSSENNGATIKGEVTVYLCTCVWEEENSSKMHTSCLPFSFRNTHIHTLIRGGFLWCGFPVTADLTSFSFYSLCVTEAHTQFVCIIPPNTQNYTSESSVLSAAKSVLMFTKIEMKYTVRSSLMLYTIRQTCWGV